MRRIRQRLQLLVTKESPAGCQHSSRSRPHSALRCKSPGHPMLIHGRDQAQQDGANVCSLTHSQIRGTRGSPPISVGKASKDSRSLSAYALVEHRSEAAARTRSREKEGAFAELYAFYKTPDHHRDSLLAGASWISSGETLQAEGGLQRTGLASPVAVGPQLGCQSKAMLPQPRQEPQKTPESCAVLQPLFI